MAGHSKWANIQHRKGAQDKKRAKIFTKIIREITVAAKMHGGDLDSNPRLRLAIDKANAANMPRDNIARAIKKGAGGMDGQEMEEIRYEGYGPAGIAVLVDCLTDNRKRTVADVRYAFTKSGGSFGIAGSVAYMFSQRGIITFEAGNDEEKIMDVALESGADDVVVNDDGSVDVYCTPESYQQVKAACDAAELTPVHSELTMMAANEIELDHEQAEKVMRLTDMLEDFDDVQSVYSNADIPADLLD